MRALQTFLNDKFGMGPEFIGNKIEVNFYISSQGVHTNKAADETNNADESYTTEGAQTTDGTQIVEGIHPVYGTHPFMEMKQ